MRSPALEAAAKLLVQGEDEKALEALVECWRGWRATALAELIDAFAARLSSTLPPVSGNGATSDRQAWVAVAAQRRSATLPRLFDVLPKGNGLIASERVIALASWPVSPLISSALTKWLEHPPFDGKTRGRCFPTVLDILEAHRDPRTVAVLTKLADPEQRSRTIRAIGLSSWKPLQRLFKRSMDWAPAPTPNAAEAAALQQLRERLGPRPSSQPSVNVAALFAAVHAQPDDETTRLMLADALQEAGDPRGEFIALQLGRAASGGAVSKRERELQGTWARDWLGALDPVLMKQGIVFERGFLARCAHNGQLPPAIHERPEWSTVTHLDVSQGARTSAGSRLLVLSRALKSLRHLSGIGSREDLRAIAEAGRPLPWLTLSLKLWTVDADTRAVFARAPLPSLERIGLFGSSPGTLSGLTEDVIEKVLSSPIGRTVRHLELAVPARMFGTLIDFAATQKLTSLAIHPTSRALSLRFDVQSHSVVICFDPITGVGMDLLVTALKSVRTGVVDRVLLKVTQRVTVADGALKTPTSRTSLRALKQAVGSAELVLPG